MAKVGKLAGLAALAGAAYMMSKGKDKDPVSKTDTGDETDRLINRGGPRRQISDYMKKAPSEDMAVEKNVSKPKSISVTKPSVSSDDILPVESGKTSLRNTEAGMSRGTRSAPLSTNTSSSSEDGMRSYSTRSGSLAGAGRGSVNPPVAKPSGPRDSEAGMSRGTRAASSEDGMKNYKPRYTPPMLASKTTQGAGRKPYMPEDVDMGIGQKRGGMVKKMASGGMTASRRADGIATKGKTRGKIC
jgi:hypothetical protein